MGLRLFLRSPLCWAGKGDTSRPLAIRAKGKALLPHAVEERGVRDLEVRSNMRHVAVIYGFELLGIVHVAR